MQLYLTHFLTHHRKEIEKKNIRIGIKNQLLTMKRNMHCLLPCYKRSLICINL